MALEGPTVTQFITKQNRLPDQFLQAAPRARGPYSRQRMALEISPANRNAVVRVVHFVSKLFSKKPIYERLYFSSFEIGCAMGAHALGAGAKAQPDRVVERCA